MGTRRPAGQHRRFIRFDCDNLDVAFVSPQRLRNPVDRMRRADRMHERVDMAAGLLPDFVAERCVAGDRIVIVQLIAPPVRRPLADLAGCPDHLLDQRFGDLPVVAPDVGDARAEGAHRQALLIAERI